MDRVSRRRRELLSLLHHADAEVRFKASGVLGNLAADMAAGDVDSVRRVVRQLLWSMNDESGGVCRGAPQAIGEILLRVPSLRAEYVPILLSFAHEEPFEAPTLWALWRLGRPAAELAGERAAELTPLAGAEDNEIAGHAVVLLAAWGIRPPEAVIAMLALQTDRRFLFFDPHTGAFAGHVLSDDASKAWGTFKN